MNLFQALRAQNFPSIAFVGAGGKTTSLFQLARQFDGPVVITTTTHFGTWEIPLADRHIITRDSGPVEAIEHNLHGVILITGEIKEDRTKSIEDNLLLWLREFCGYYSLPLLIEADGSKQKPLKAPEVHEPPIPDFIDLVVQIAGLSGLGKLLDDESVHRAKIFSRLSGLKIGEPITADQITRVLSHPNGGLKNIPTKARRVALLNQADTLELQAQAKRIGKNLLPAFDAIITASLKNEQIHAVEEPVAGIILAAGESTRFGQPKQLLDWHGEPFVRAVARTALITGLSPVIVVTGAIAEQVTAAVNGLPVLVTHNAQWQSGQASSIKAGLQTLTHPPILGEGNPGAAIFLLADQPQITPPILQKLVDEHATTLSPVIAPLVLDHRANPVLFDRITFKDLMKLEGDMGGRGIFSKHKVHYLPWHDDTMLLDVDTPEQYQRLKDLLE